MKRYDRKAIRRLREERGLDLNAMIARSGLGARTLYYLDRGITVPRADTLARLAAALDVAVDSFYVDKQHVRAS
jgi:transcriptional regulator with XRE-family HTH domain